MFKEISENITVALAAHDIIKVEEMETYNYGLELLIPKVILYVAILVVSTITSTFLISLIFVVLFMSLRRYAGGFHCKTAGACLCLSFLIYLIVLLGNVFVGKISNVFYAVSSAVSATVILVFSPVEDKNKLLEKEEKEQYRIRTLIALALVTAIELITSILSLTSIQYIAACSLTANAVLTILAVGRCKYEAYIAESSGKADGKNNQIVK